ncbi:hypothetical protein HDK90DRAFT_155080 [Phyllosticta capitalensis]|uniref:DUF6594 domain-containing protein n=1 Tax=Phyllosticta capitalensis TaxID=121624 RepID=A0ABR1Z0E2_9PEZI
MLCSAESLQHQVMNQDAETRQIGYTKFAKFLCEPRFQNFRSFRYLRTRILLRQQHELMRLEKELQRLDEEDAKNHAFSLLRLDEDKNEQRAQVLMEIDRALEKYDHLLQRAQWAVAAPRPHEKRVEHVRRATEWFLGRGEEEYLNNGDLLHAGHGGEGNFGRLLVFSDALLLGSSNPDVGDYERPSASSRVARTIIAIVTVLILLVPVLILNYIETTGMRLMVVFISAAVFTSSLTILTSAGTNEVFVAGATFCAVLVVFVSQNGSSGKFD